MNDASPSPEMRFPKPPLWLIVAIFAIFAVGLTLRIVPLARLPSTGPDERFYAVYVTQLGDSGLLGYSDLFDSYIAYQSKPSSQLVLPPSRVVFISVCHVWSKLSGRPAMSAIYDVALLSSILTLAIAFVFATRLSGIRTGAATLLLMAVAPLQLYIAQRGLINGFFALLCTCGLWFLWESLRTPSKRCEILFGITLAALIATKENAAFVAAGYFTAAVVYFVTTRRRPARSLVLNFLLGTLGGIAILAVAAGGLETLIHALQLNVQKSYVSPYAHATGDGPWHRYLIDLVIISPTITIAAIAGITSFKRSEASWTILTVFLITTYVLMCQIKLGMNARYTLIWDFPLRWFAVMGILRTPEGWRYRRQATAVIVMALALSELFIANALFFKGRVYDPVPASTLRALRVLGPGP